MSRDSNAVVAYIALGSNLDGPQQRVRDGFAALGQLPQTKLLKCSSLYRTTPVGYADQPDFINAVVAVETELSPRALLDVLLALERTRGRERGVPNGPRTLDLDILLYGDQTISETGLTIPHPRMHQRAFVLAPLVEIAPHVEIPDVGRADALLARADARGVERLQESV